MSRKYISRNNALKKLQKYCAYQDRCHQEVRRKLLDMGVWGKDADDIVVALIEERFLDEERFARSYARGKFRMKKWGRQRILSELRKREISDYCQRKAMEEIEPDDYQAALEELFRQKLAELKGLPPFILRNRIAQFLIRRGYERGLVWDLIQQKAPV